MRATIPFDWMNSVPMMIKDFNERAQRVPMEMFRLFRVSTRFTHSSQNWDGEASSSRNRKQLSEKLAVFFLYFCFSPTPFRMIQFLAFTKKRLLFF